MSGDNDTECIGHQAEANAGAAAPIGHGLALRWRHEPPMELVEQRAPALAVRLPAWCAVASHRPSGARRYDKSAYPARSASQASWRHFAKEESYA